jgi:hypothetical protein
MPLIEIAALPLPVHIDTAALTVELNRAVADAIPCRLDAVWTVWRTVSGPYTRGDDARLEMGRETHGPVVHVYLRRTPEETQRAVETIDAVLTRVLSLAPGNVFVTVQPVELNDPSA